MATRKTSNSDWKELAKFLRTTPRTEKTAREREGKAFAMATEKGILVHKRKEGGAFHTGLNLYPPEDKGSVGAMLYNGERIIAGWRWSLIRSHGQSWAEKG